MRDAILYGILLMLMMQCTAQQRIGDQLQEIDLTLIRIGGR